MAFPMKRIPPAELRRLYVDKQLSTQEIADVYGVAASTVQRKLRANDIELRQSGLVREARRTEIARKGARALADRLGAKGREERARKAAKAKARRIGPPWRLDCLRCGHEAWLRPATHGGDPWPLVVEAWCTHALKAHGIERCIAEPMLWDQDQVLYSRPGEYDPDDAPPPPSASESGRKGGRIAIAKLSRSQHCEQSSAGGKARAESLTPERRSEIAAAANHARRLLRTQEIERVQVRLPLGEATDLLASV